MKDSIPGTGRHGNHLRMRHDHLEANQHARDALSLSPSRLRE
jgi:hypothetical protein